jgi:hypothetical protein
MIDLGKSDHDDPILLFRDLQLSLYDRKEIPHPGHAFPVLVGICFEAIFDSTLK